MDGKLVGWARGVKARLGKARSRGAEAWGLPVLWLFTDAARLGDVRAAVAGLPAGLCGVVLRDDAACDRAALVGDLARICRARRNLLVVAGDARLAWAVGAGVHLRGGRRLWPGAARGVLVKGVARGALVTSSAHGVGDLWRAWRAGAGVAFLSPAFATASHPGAAGLGAARWRRLAAAGPPGLVVGALGGIDGASVRRLGVVRCVGAIGALAPS